MKVKLKDDFIEDVARRGKFTLKDTSKFLDAIIDELFDSISEGYKVIFSGFGNFEVRERKGRPGTNPRTQKPIKIPPTRVPYFHASQKLRDAVKNNIKNKEK